MIRLPPTSISLSESDIQYHLHQLDIHHGLLRQGFKNDEIARYLEDYRLSSLAHDSNPLDDYSIPAPSTVDLAIRRTHKLSHDTSNTDKLLTARIAQECCPHNTSETESYFEDEGDDFEPDRLQTSGDKRDPVRRKPQSVPASPIILPTVMQSTSHAPRKSSLLRFSKAASSESSSSEAHDSVLPFLPPAPSPRRYRPRSHSYPYQSSEQEFFEDDISARVNHMCLSDFAQSALSRDSSQSNSVSLPPPFSATPRRSFRGMMPTSPTIYGGAVDNSEDEWSSDSSHGNPTRSQSHGSLDSVFALPEIPSSPPIADSSPEPELSVADIDMNRLEHPQTPVSRHRSVLDSQTEPRRHRHRYLDGNAFSVYNDSLPSNEQPQTPADLSRGHLVTEQDVSYTAPPGMMRDSTHSSIRRELSHQDNDIAEQSPLARAINLNHRRNREMRRNVRSNLDRLRRDSELAERMRETGVDHLPDQVTWREEFELDSLGEENFENDFELHQRVMRVVSGNAHWDAITDVER